MPLRDRVENSGRMNNLYDIPSKMRATQTNGIAVGQVIYGFVEDALC
jgi:hypothetical protein